VRVWKVVVLVGLAAAIGLGIIVYAARREAKRQLTAQAQIAPAPTVNDEPKEEITHLAVERGTSFGELLLQAGLDARTTQEAIDAARPLMNFHRLRQGQEVTLIRTLEGEVVSLHYRPEPAEEIIITRVGDGFEARKRDVPVTTEVVRVAGTIESSLFDAVTAAGEEPELAVRLAEIFAWDLDFYTDPRPGDEFRLIFEKKKYQGEEAAEYGQIFVAEYNNAGHPHQAVLFHDPNGRPAYYGPHGESLQKAFLRSPLKFAARISSHYSLHRFHPVLKRYRPHLGTDYAAPVGTPVQAVASGRVVFAGLLGGDGRMVRLKHANGYETYYLHLSRILVHTGQGVEQGQLIGRVGATGLATGPHLDFRVRRSGSFVNFERMKLPPARPVARKILPEFEATRDKWLADIVGPSALLARTEPTRNKQVGAP
jgi:murein DD-endopeptidase MepM/ murein hydrolase activator NlpD